MTAVMVPCGRGTTNKNARGSSEDRRRRREWLISTYRANVDVIRLYPAPFSGKIIAAQGPLGSGKPACRCFRCGKLLINEMGPDGFPMPHSMTVDRILPGCRGGTYRRSNIRPACPACNSEMGGPTRRKRRSR